MSQEQESIELEDKTTEDEYAAGINVNFSANLWSAFLLIMIFVMLCICTVLLVLTVNLNNEVKGINAKLMALEKSGQYAASYSDSDSADAFDIHGGLIDETEAADIAAVAEMENQIVRNAGDRKTTGIRKVYLTFDDGPSQNTDKILDVLKQYDVKATFFVVGKENYVNQYRRIIDEGHTLAMHSYSHVYNNIYSSLDAYKEDLTKLKSFLYEITGVECNIVRFPGGSSNTISQVDMGTLIEYLNSEGMVYFDWNVSSGDAVGGNKDAKKIAANVLDNIDKYGTAVVLMHDAAGKTSTIEALPIIIESILESDDTVLLPISSETVKVQHIR